MILPHPSLRQGLVGAWCPSLGASGYTLLDRSGRNRNASVVGGVAWSAIPGGLSVSPNGVTGYYDTGTNCGLAGSTRAAITFWASRTSTADNVIVGSGNQFNRFNVYWANNGNVYWQTENSSQSYPSSPLTGTGISHFVWQIDQGTSTAWVNGIQQTLTVGGVASASQLSATLGNFRIGQEASSNTFGRGFIDDVRIYNRALTPAEIRLLASRRGIGLRPAAPLYDDDSDLQNYPVATPGKRLAVNVGGVWTPAAARANTGGSWGNGSVGANVGGAWQ